MVKRSLNLEANPLPRTSFTLGKVSFICFFFVFFYIQKQKVRLMKIISRVCNKERTDVIHMNDFSIRQHQKSTQ